MRIDWTVSRCHYSERCAGWMKKREARVFLREVDAATWIFEARRSRPGQLFALAHLEFRTRPFLFDDHDMPLVNRVLPSA